MDRLSADELASVDVVADNIEQLRDLFPEAFTEDGIDFDVLRQLLGDGIADADEKYGLNWHGKRRARQIALTPSTGTLRPCPEDSVDWDTTKNLMIEGDNLEVLKLLQKSYAGKVKLIYIDPPYNTGKDFVYKDNFRDNIANYLELTGQTEGGAKLTSNTEASGRFHTDWLNMMYPRLKLARNLLRDDGVILATIDDTEAGNLRVVMDEVFGEENHAASIAWKKRSSPDARTTVGSIHDSVLCYVRNSDHIRSAIGKIALTEERRKAYSNPDNDPRGDWASVDMTGMVPRAPRSQFYDITLPSGRTIEPPKGRSWGLALRTFEEMRADDRIWFGADGDNVPRVKKFLSESEGQVVASFWDMSDVGSNDEAKKDVNELMGAAGVFDTPKPVRLIRRMIDFATSPQDIVLDFFAGSGTTGQATIEHNADDEGRRRFILVQLPEPLDPEARSQSAAAEFCDQLKKPRNIAELTKERLRRAGLKIKNEHPGWTGDIGFRTFKLDASNIRPWEADAEHLGDSLLDNVDHIRDDRTEDDLLYELLLKLGLDLCVPAEARTIADHTVQSVGAGTLMVCLDEHIDRPAVEPLALGIVGWHTELDPAGDTTVLFRDSAFADDVAKTNLTAILHQNQLTSVRSL